VTGDAVSKRGKASRGGEQKERAQMFSFASEIHRCKISRGMGREGTWKWEEDCDAGQIPCRSAGKENSRTKKSDRGNCEFVYTQT